MKWFISVSFGELTLKGKNRNKFVKQAITNIKRNIKDFDYGNIFMESGKVYIEANKNDFPKMISEIKKVFGIIYISEVLMTDKNIDSIKNAVDICLNDFGKYENKTFKVEGHRVDKSFEMNSPEIGAYFGAYILKKYNNMKVDVHNPDLKVFIDIRKDAFVYINRIPALGGLPIGSGGEGLLLLSGGIDSPVAGYMMAKRGLKISAIHFHSYPFTSKRAHKKSIDLAQILSKYTGEMKVYSLNLLPVYTAIGKKCQRKNTTILSRRFMMRIAEKIANENKIQALITGENLGQVASQTIQSISVINDVVSIPILRPCIGMDKNNIIEIARKIDTYEKAIEPYEDCCSVFTPDRPVTKPRLKDIQFDEKNLDIEYLVDEVMKSLEIIEI